MTEEHRLISAESVTEGHPDKVCDQISDAILDDLLAQDSSSHVAVETSAATGVFLVFGEVTSKGYCDVQSKVRETLRNIGYTSSEVGLDADSCGVVVAITEQSAEINQGVARLTGDQETAASREERYEAQGAGDQGVMFGYATDLRSKTQGRGQYSMEPADYQQVPKSVADKIMTERNKG